MLIGLTQQSGKLEFAGRARGQCVTNLVYPITSFGPLDQKPLENWNLAGRTRGQCVTNLVYLTTSFGPLDQNRDEN